MAGTNTLNQRLSELLGAESVVDGSLAVYATDATEHEGLRGRPDAVVLPDGVEAVAALVRWAYAEDVALVPRGGGTGFAGGAVPIEGGVVVDLSRMASVRQFDPGLWRMHVDAGVSTATVRRLARENGLYFPPDPGAHEQSQIGGNIATNAGGPHAFKYGVTGAWVTGIEAIVPPGDLVTAGGAIRKDVAGYDLKHLLIGSEGTLGIITGAWLRLTPAPEVMLPIVASYATAAAGCAAIEAIMASGVVPAAIEFLEGAAVDASRAACPVPVPEEARFMLLVEADGSAVEAELVAGEVREALDPASLLIAAPSSREQITALWRWRDGVSLAVSALRGGKVSEDIVVPIDRITEAIEGTLAIGREHGLQACSWGHAGDGNLHSTFMIDVKRPDELERAHLAARGLHELAARLGGSISGEHGVGWLKRGQLQLQWSERALELHREIKRVFDPKGLLNPGKKV